MKWEDLVQRRCTETTDEEQIFEAGQVRNVSCWDLASSEKGRFPGCCIAARPVALAHWSIQGEKQNKS